MVRRRSEGVMGFTLIEVMVALAIIAVALLSALRAAGQGTVSVGELRARLLAGWVAENLLAEHRARGEWLPLGIQRGTQYQAGIEFRWREEVTAMPSPAFRRIDVFVFATPEEAHSLARLSGFVVQAQGGSR